MTDTPHHAPMGDAVRQFYRERRANAVKPEHGLILVNTGEGKGKTTAALGLALRAVGTGWRVMMIQFIKGSWRTGEREAAARLAPDLTITPLGKGFTWDSKHIEDDITAAQEAWQTCVPLIEGGEYELVILDEINYVIAYGFLPLQPVLDTLARRPKHVHVCLTGRNAPPELIAAADLVTEMHKVKHPFDQGILAQAGIDF